MEEMRRSDAIFRGSGTLACDGVVAAEMIKKAALPIVVHSYWVLVKRRHLLC